jgi:hypothetical protein
MVTATRPVESQHCVSPAPPRPDRRSIYLIGGGGRRLRPAPLGSGGQAARPDQDAAAVRAASALLSFLVCTCVRVAPLRLARSKRADGRSIAGQGRTGPGPVIYRHI